MKKLMGVLVLLVCSGGCIISERDGYRHHGREASVESGHSHCYGCGHVRVGSVWYIRS